MVTSLANKHKAGNMLDLIGVREIRDGVLCLRPSATFGKKSKQARDYRAVLIVQPVNFSLMEEGEQEIILEGFRIFLQRLQVHQQISIHVQIRPYDLQPYLDKLQEAQASPSTIIREMATEHEQFVLDLASRHAILQRQFYIRISAQPETPKNRKKLKPVEIFDQAKTQLDLISQSLLDDLKRANLSGHRLDDEELAQYYLSCLHTHFSESHPLNPATIQAIDRPLTPVHLRDALRGQVPLSATSGAYAETTALIVPGMTEEETTVTQEQKPTHASRFTRKEKQKKPPQETEPAYHVKLAELVAPSMINEQEHFIKIYRESTEYFRGRAIVGYPSYVIAGWLDRLIQIDEPYLDIVIYLETVESTRYVNKLTHQITGYRATQVVDDRHGRVENPHIKIAREEVELLRDQLVQQTERVHTASIYLGIRAETEKELAQRDEKLVMLLRSLDLESVELSLEHLQAWLCMLPDNVDVLGRHKVLETSSVVTAFPFSSASLSTEPGALVGVMPAGSLVIVNPISPQLENGHEIKFARSGAGKSYHEKVWLMRLLIQGFESIIIDPEDEYGALCQKFQGANIRLASGRLQLNPFDLPLVSDTERNILEEKMQSLLVMCDLLLADKEPGVLSQREKAFLTRCFTRAYADKGITSDPSTHTSEPPCMQDLYSVITSGECGADTFDLGDRLLRHLDAFPKATDVHIDNQLIVFNIRDLSDDLKPVGLFLAADFVWTQVRRERHPRPRVLTIDEAWMLLAFPEGGRFLESMSRRARKYNLILRIISQNVEDFLSCDEGRTILANSATKFLMKQDSSTIDVVTRAFRLSEGERKFLLTCNPGEGLYYTGLSHVPLKVVASETEHRIATTNPQELLKEEQEAQAHRQETNTDKEAEALALKKSRDEYAVVFPRFYRAEDNTI